MGDPIVERTRWTVGGRAAFARVTRTEAERLAAGAPVRHAVQRLLLELQAAFPTLDGLLLYVVEAERVVGFAELRLDDGRFDWRGPHLAARNAA